MGMFNYIKSKLGSEKDKDVPATEQFYTPLRIALHSTLDIRTVDLIMLKDNMHPAMVIPKGQCEVMAIGKFSLDGTPVHQVYLRDSSGEEFTLQIAEGKDYRSQKPTVEEILLFKQIVALEPETEASLERALSNIGFSDIEIDDVRYERIWGDPFTEKMEFRKFNEQIITPGETKNFTDEYILYGRTIQDITGESQPEFLLVGLEEEDTGAQLAMHVGIKINVTDVVVQ